MFLHDYHLACEISTVRSDTTDLSTTNAMIFSEERVKYTCTHAGRGGHHSVRHQVNVQTNQLEDVLKQTNHLQRQHVLQNNDTANDTTISCRASVSEKITS